MKIREIMTADPICCLPEDKAQAVARIMKEHNIGSVPVVLDSQSRRLVGIITDRDLCCSIVAGGLDPKSTPIEKLISLEVVACREGENVDSCERLMQQHQIRRIPVVDGEGRLMGIVAQADLALKDKPEKVSKTVAEISKPKSSPLAA